MTFSLLSVFNLFNFVFSTEGKLIFLKETRDCLTSRRLEKTYLFNDLVLYCYVLNKILS